MVRPAGGETRSETVGVGGDVVRKRFCCRGTVQGVGFRPAVYRLATSLGLAGSVRNDADGATIEVEGAADQVARFEVQLATALPPLARLVNVNATDVAARGDVSFHIEVSSGGSRRRALIPPDAALCDDCRADMEDPTDRRHRYAFTTCTNCGPRFSLAVSLPYDRHRTSMAVFPLCDACNREYTDPTSRRFHAEPICCPACGPTLELTDNAGRRMATDEAALEGARELLLAGKIIALKGLGGFQVACRADRPETIAMLRRRKRRLSKPFAVMVRDLHVARRIVCLRSEDERLLLSACSPVLLAPKRQGMPVAGEVAPGLNDVGVMLPTTPLHVELFREACYDALVMTSGNTTDEPIARENDEAIERLGSLVDGFLLHDREVVRRVDDSVVRSANCSHIVVRRSRGWTPEPVRLPIETPEPVLALGGHLQNTVCLAVGSDAFCSQHVGDLDTTQAREFLREVVAGLEDFLEVRPTVIACDLHPDYPSTWFARKLAEQRGGRLMQFQHHLAHAAGVLGENDAMPTPEQAAAAIVLDGTGFGLDGTSWGGEFISMGAGLTWRRCARCEPLPLIGGERAVREPWRVAIAALVRGGTSQLIAQLPFASHVSPDICEQVVRLAEAEAETWPMSSGAGRVFEAAGAMFGLCTANGYEGEAAARFEALAEQGAEDAVAWSELSLPDDREELPTASLLSIAAQRLVDGEPSCKIAREFHLTFCELAADLAKRVFARGERVVALGGGCMVSRLLLKYLSEGLECRGFDVVWPKQLPPGDGGLAYGQAVLAAASIACGHEPMQEGG